MLMCESLNIIISRRHCWAFKLKTIIKRSEVENSLSCSLLCCMHDVLVCCPAEKKFVICEVFDSS